MHQLGGGYTFIGREYKLNIGDKKNYIDYLFYNVVESRYCVVEIKSREYKKSDYGQIKTYMNYIDEHLKNITQNSTIGIIITKSVNKFEAHYVKDNQVTIVEFKINKVVEVSQEEKLMEEKYLENIRSYIISEQTRTILTNQKQITILERKK